MVFYHQCFLSRLLARFLNFAIKQKASRREIEFENTGSVPEFISAREQPFHQHKCFG
jgi:hypothetical protein